MKSSIALTRFRRPAAAATIIYLALKFLHIVAAIVFLGNITTVAFWVARAHKNRDFRLIASTFDGIIRADRVFTMPAVLGLVLTGIAAAVIGGLPVFGTGWILWGIVLFIITGMIFGRLVAPVQHEIASLAQGADTNEANEASDANWGTYEQLYNRWRLWGYIALAVPVAAVVIMVFKPALPAF